MQQNNMLSPPPSVCNQFQEPSWMSEQLDYHHKHVRVPIFHQEFEIVFHGGYSFVARRNRIGNAQSVRIQTHVQNRGHGSALRQDGHAFLGVQGDGRRTYKCQWDGVDVVDHAQTVRAFDCNAVFLRQLCKTLLFETSSLAALSKSGSEDNRAANSTLRTEFERVENCAARDGKNGAIDSVRQLRSRAKTSSSANEILLWIDKKNLARVASRFQIEEKAVTQRSRRR